MKLAIANDEMEIADNYMWSKGERKVWRRLLEMENKNGCNFSLIGLI